MAAERTIRTERDGGVVTVVMDRGEKRNALDLSRWREIGETFRALHEDESIRCLVLRGGKDVFCAGADIAQFPETRTGVEKARRYGEAIAEAMAAVHECPFPVIAAIRGDCVGGGLEISAACDLRVATPRSRFGVPIARIGVVMAYAELQGLHRLVGPAAAAEILLTGELFSAADAYRLGLLTRVFSEEEFEASLKTLVDRIVAGAPLSHRWHKRFLRRLADPRPLTDAEKDETYAYAKTSDYAEGIGAFLQKRTPRFEGR